MTDKKKVRECVVGCLRELANLSLQRRSWGEGSGEGSSSPEELICQLFDDSALGDLLDGESCVFTPVVDALLVELGRQVDVVDLRQPVDLLLRDPLWHDVVSIASRALLGLSEAWQEP